MPLRPAIRIEELTTDYAIGFWRKRPYRALDRLTLEIEPGEVFGFLGPNGAGKTTTLKLLMQLTFPTAGRAEILGKPVGDVAVRRRIGYLPENPSFYDYLTAEDLLNYFAQLFGYSAADRRARVPALLDRVGIGGERRLHLRKFSKGMIQRVGRPGALNDPEVIFLDEPMSGLDPLGRRDVRALISRCATRAARSSSAPTSSPTPRRCAAGSRSSPAGVWRRAGGWPTWSRSNPRLGAVVANLSPEVHARVAAEVRRATEIAPALHAGAAARAAAGSDALGPGRDRRRSCRSTRSVTPRGLLRARRRRRRRTFGEGAIRDRVPRPANTMRAIRSIAVHVFGVGRDRVPYNPSLRRPPHRGVLPWPAHRRAGRQDHRIRAERPRSSAVHLVFIGTGWCEGGRAPEHLRALSADQPAAVRPRQHAGLVLTLAVNVLVMTIAIYAVLGYMSWTSPHSSSRWEAPGPIRRCSRRSS